MALILLLAGGAQAANRQTAVVPPQFAAIDHDGYGGTLVPPVWLQQVYGASLLPPDVILIEALRFRRDRLVAPLTEGWLDLRLSLSTTTKAPDGLSSVRSENVGSDETVVFEGVLNLSSTGLGTDGGPNPFDIEIPFAEVFRYDPQAGNLLLDFRVISGTEGLYVDGSNAAEDQASRVFGPLEATANTLSDTGADIIELVYQWADPPEECVPMPSGLVGWWQAEGTVEDTAGVFQGTLLGGGGYAAGRVGLGWDLTVPWSHVRIVDALALRLTHALTVELWVKPQQTGMIRSLVDKWDAVLGPNQASFGLGLDTDGTPYFVVSPSGLPMEYTAVFATNAPAPANVWSHVAATYDGLMLRIYVDGQLKGTQPYDLGIFPGMGDLGIGGVVGGVAVGDLISPLGGFIDEVGLYRRPLAPQEIAAIYEAGALGKCDSPPSRVPLARWGFDAMDGWVAEDSIGTLHGALSPVGALFVSEGVRGNALRLFRAEGGHVSMGNALDFAGAFTLVTWVKTAVNDTTETSVLLGKYQVGSVNGYYLGLNRAGFIGQPGKALFVASDDPGQELVSTSSVNDGQWHQVVAVYDAGREKQLYVDGRPVEATGMTSTIRPNNGSFLVGGVNLGDEAQGHFDGWIDELQVYDRVLSEAEVHYLYLHPDAMELPDLLPPVITSGPADQTVIRGTNVELAVTATGEPPLSYVWSKDGVVLPGATEPSLLLTEVQPEAAGLYSVTVGNVWGTADASATLIVRWPPVITVPPVAQVAAMGASVTFSVAAEGGGVITYQWFKNRTPLPGANSRFLLLGNVQGASAGSYTVRVRNQDGEVSSPPATLRVYSGELTVEFAEGSVLLKVEGLQGGSGYSIDVASELSAVGTVWESLVSVVDISGSFQFIDPEASTAEGSRYYRVRMLP